MDEDFEIGDVENFGGKKDHEFSHSMLVMSAMKRCVDAGCKEMREGWFNERKDSQGNIIKTYIEDTRKAFIESVRTLQMVMACDLDEEAVEKIKKYLSSIETEKQNLIKYDDEVWNKLTNAEKINYTRLGYKHYSKILSNPLLQKHFIEYELGQWRNVFSELSRLTKRLDFFQAEVFEV